MEFLKGYEAKGRKSVGQSQEELNVQNIDSKGKKPPKVQPLNEMNLKELER